MVFQDDLLEMMWCPVTRVPLRLMTARELAELNAKIAPGGVRYASGEPVTDALDCALATIDGTSAYRIQDGVPDLLPGQRVLLRGRVPEPGKKRPRSSEFGQWDARWDELSTNWDQIQPPLRPLPEDIDLLQRLIAEAVAGTGRASTSALLLGVTSEIATMRWPRGTRLLALDSSAGMIRNLWPSRKVRDAAAARADWTMMPVRDGACDIVVGDGIFTTLQYPDHFFALEGEVRRVIKDTGTLALRLFARPQEREPLETIFSDLRGGRTQNPHILPWRIAMAVHGDLATGARLGDIWDAWCEYVPDPTGLMKALGWPGDSMRFLEVYRDVEAHVSLPTLGEVRDLLAREFIECECHVPEYESGDRYPTVVFKPRPH